MGWDIVDGTNMAGQEGIGWERPDGMKWDGMGYHGMGQDRTRQTGQDGT